MRFKTVRRPLPPPHPPTDIETLGWFVAADQRRNPTYQDVREVKAYFEAKYPRRWKQMKKDSDWATKKLAKQMGLTEEDAKSFLWWAL
jgi:hypothetical protein